MTFFESLIIGSLEGIYGTVMWSDIRRPRFGEVWEDIDTDRRKEIEAWCAYYSVDVEQMIEALRQPA